MNVIEKFQGCLFCDASVIVASITECIAGTYYGIPRKYIKKANTIYVRKLTELLVSYISEQSESTVSSLGYKIKSYIDENYLTVFTKNNLAEVFNYSNSHITRVFKETFNVTPSQYCTKLIAKRILNLIEENYSVSQIAIMLDFSSPENLSRFFKKHMGSSPSKYTKK